MATTQAERNSRKSPPATLLDRFWFATFFAIGAAIGTFVAVGLIDHGISTPIALLAGSTAGGYGGWFVFFAISWLALIIRPKAIACNSDVDNA